jgi:hypothetical protein
MPAVEDAMDYSTGYVKMCEGAVEMQRRWGVLAGDLFFEKSSFVTMAGVSDGAVSLVDERTMTDVVNGVFKKSKAVWLPRQCQMQEMLDVTNPREAAALINEFLKEEEKAGGYRCRSMEQAWLSIVMRRTHGLVWDGDKWAG